MDKMRGSILEDGRIKLETDRISPANHMAADKFHQNVIRLMGGLVDRVKKKITHAHDHDHAHEHHHEH